MRRAFPIIAITSFCLLFTFFSCSPVKNYKYFQEISDSAKITKIMGASYKELVIHPDDILSISVQTLDPVAGNSINGMNSSSTAGLNVNAYSASTVMGNAQNNTGYLVDKNGFVQVPLFGEFKVEGLTTSEIRQLIEKKAVVYFNYPSVIVKLINFKITVIGEVQHPGTFIIPNERVSILDALGLAGDLSISGKRDNMLLIRKDKDGNDMAGVRLNLNSISSLQSPYFYLKQNDVLYIEPLKTKIDASDATQTRNIGIFTATLSLLIVLLSRIK